MDTKSGYILWHMKDMGASVWHTPVPEYVYSSVLWQPCGYTQACVSSSVPLSEKTKEKETLLLLPLYIAD